MSKKQKKADSNLTVTTQKGISKSILSLLEKTVLGTPGKLRYKHTETENTVKCTISFCLQSFQEEKEIKTEEGC